MSRLALPACVALICAFAVGACSPAPAPPPAVVRPAPPTAEAVVAQAAQEAAAERAATEKAAADQPQAPGPGASAGTDEAAAKEDAAEPVLAEQTGAVAAPNVEALRQKLTTTVDPVARVAAIDEIASLGQKARPALDDFVKAAGDEDSRVRWHAARGIGLIGEDAASAVPVLVKLLGDREWIVAAQAAAAIGAIRRDESATTITAAEGETYAAAKEALVKATVHADPRVRRAAIRSLRVLSPDPEVLAPLVCKQLCDADPSVVLPALHSLADMGDDALPLLTQSLKDPRSRYWATIALTEMGESAAPAADLLTKTVAEGELDEQMQAILALAAIGPKAAAATPLLVKILDSKDKALHFAAAFALGKLRAAEADAVLERTTADPDESLASVAAWARTQLHPDDRKLLDDAIVRLRKGLASDSATIREGSAASLSDLAGRLDDAGKKTLAVEFADLLNDPDPMVGLAAGAGLIRLGGAAVETLTGRLADPAVRPAVLEILAAIGPAAEPALDDLTQALSDPDPAYRGEAAVAIAAIGPAARSAVPRLQAILADTQAPAELRYAAAYAVGRIGPSALAAEQVLRELAQSQDELMATVAAWALLKVDPADTAHVEVAIPKLRRALRGDREMARLEAAVALGDIGAAAAGAVPILELVSEEDSSKAVRSAAAEALAKIRGNDGTR